MESTPSIKNTVIHDAPTDVLSFPMLSYESAGDFSKLEDDYDDNFNPDTGEIMLGDIIISVDKVKESGKKLWAQ